MITTSVATVRPLPTVAAASVALSLALTAIGTAEPFRDSDVAPAWGAWAAFTLPTILGSAALILGFLHRIRQRDGHGLARSAVVLGVLSVLSLGMPWTGLPCVLAGGAILAAHDALRQGTSRAPATAALGLALAAVAGAVVAALIG